MARLTVLVLLLGLSVAPAPAVAASGPTTYWGAKAGPVGLPAARATAVATLPLPAGRYLVTATATLVGKFGPAAAVLPVDCRLVLGSSKDRVTAALTPFEREGSRAPILLTVAGRLRSSGDARLRCKGGFSKGSIRIRDIRMTAIGAGKLTLRGSTSRTYGSGSPRVISWASGLQMGAWIKGDGTYQDLGYLDLPKGRWWLMAKAVADSGVTGSGYRYRCRLTAGADYDEMGFGIPASSSRVRRVPLALEVVHWFASPGLAVLQCKGPSGFVARDITITAVKAGRLTNISLDPATGWSSGWGSPRIISGYANGNLPYMALVPASKSFKTVRKLSLPKGRWTVLAKLWFEGSAGTSGIQGAWCRLVFGKQTSPTQLRWVDDASGIAPIVLSINHQAKSPQSIKLQCRRWGPGGIGNAYFIKITALRAGTLVKRHL